MGKGEEEGERGGRGEGGHDVHAFRSLDSHWHSA